MVSLKTVLYSQYPAAILLAILFLIIYAVRRKNAAFRAFLFVLLYGFALAGGVLLFFLGVQAELWTLKTIWPFTVWNWIGGGVVAVLFFVFLVNTIEKKHSKHVLEKKLRKAEEEKETAVAAAREEGRIAAENEAEAVALAAAKEPFSFSAPEPSGPSETFGGDDAGSEGDGGGDAE